MSDFEARYYGSALGRFTSPDPENAGSDPADPQSWNGYAYVTNNPLTSIDPDGRAGEEHAKSCLRQAMSIQNDFPNFFEGGDMNEFAPTGIYRIT